MIRLTYVILLIGIGYLIYNIGKDINSSIEDLNSTLSKYEEMRD